MAFTYSSTIERYSSYAHTWYLVYDTLVPRTWYVPRSVFGFVRAYVRALLAIIQDMFLYGIIALELDFEVLHYCCPLFLSMGFRAVVDRSISNGQT